MLYKSLICAVIGLFLISSISMIAQDNKKKKKSKAKTQTEMPTNTPATLITHTDSLSYALGYSYGAGLSANLKNDTIDFKPELMKQGFNDGVINSLSVMSPEVAQGYLMALQQEIMAKRQKAQDMQKDMNKQKGDQFLAENKKKDGVVTLPSGLQYKIITQGNGKKPTETDQVKVHYTGTLIDGKKFDSSVDRGEPITFPVNGVIKGWTEALKLMPQGSKWMLYIPPDLAYGDRGAGQLIGPNEVLIFEVELLEVISQ